MTAKVAGLGFYFEIPAHEEERLYMCFGNKLHIICQKIFELYSMYNQRFYEIEDHVFQIN